MSSEDPSASPSWFGRQKEELVLKLCDDHMDNVLRVVESLRDSVNSFKRNEGKLASYSDKVIEQEQDADEKKAEVFKELSKGGLPQLSSEAIVRLIMTTDDIAENARAAAEKIAFLEPEKVDESIRVELEKLSNFAYEAVKLLRDVFSISLYEDLTEAVEKTAEVEKMEEKVDIFRAEKLTPKIIEWANESDRTGDSIILVEIEGNIEEVVDQAENSADVIREIALGTV